MKPAPATAAQGGLLAVVEQGRDLGQREIGVGQVALGQVASDLVFDVLEGGALVLQSALLRAGATRITTDARVVHAPRLKVHPAAAWIAEMASLPSDSGDADTLVLVTAR